MVVQIGGDVAGAGGVDLDRAAFRRQFRREQYRLHVQRRLGRVVGHELDPGIGPGRIAVEGERTQAAGQVDHPACRRAFEQRQHGLGDDQRPERVRQVDGLVLFQVRLAGQGILQAHPGVVDQHVEPPGEIAPDLSGHGLDVLGVGHVELDRARVDPKCRQLLRRRAAASRVPRSQQHGHAVILAELAGDLVPDAFVGAGDQCHPLV